MSVVPPEGVDTSVLAQGLGHLLYYFDQVRPMLPTYLFLFASSILPIYAGAHASLHRPVSAAKPPKTKKQEGASLEVRIEEETNMMQGFEKLDVILYPIFAGAMLAGLYWLITYLEDAAVLLITNILNVYMSTFGLIGIFSFLSDALEVLFSFLFPSHYLEAGRVWMVDDKRRLTLPAKMHEKDRHPGARTSPWPTSLVRLGLSDSFLWWLRDLANRPAVVIELQVFKLVTKIRPTPIRVFCAQVAIGAVAYYNLVDRVWWLTNLLGFSFTYSALQMLSPTTFQIGTMLLSALLVYDIYMVFFTPMMITVATKLDIPAKIMIPNPDIEGRRAFSMLGLGDIVIPGMMMALALRFDLYLFYLKRQKYLPNQQPKSYEEACETKSEDIPEGPAKQVASSSSATYTKAMYQKVTGTWGDRYWLGSFSRRLVGGQFPKVYFYASVVGYLLGLTVTLAVLHIFEHGQPALLYLVPGVLGSIWLTALVRGEAGIMWKYTEDPDEGRKAGIDSASILHGERPTEVRSESTADQTKALQSSESKPQAEMQNGAEKLNGTKTEEKEDTSEDTHTGAGTVELHEKQEQSEDKSNNDQNEMCGEGRRTETPAGEKTADQERRVFRLTISLPVPPLHRHASKPGEQPSPSGDVEGSKSEQTTLNWADGEPLEKRRRIS